MKKTVHTNTIADYEAEHLFLAFCSFVTLSNIKKMNLANVFLILLQNKELRDLFKIYCDVDTDFAIVQSFLRFDPSLYKSKYVMKYLNNNKKKLTM